ncbi:chromosome partitioning protein ParA [Vibrio cholerae]|uniref:phage repressor protein CI n=1 Tax=Vibrio cholerae TaxID=666 RepID=UPI0011F0F0DA|nr:phage repressor protein CI [Vibrio cholerae]EKG0028406.1 phage repressor protein CI [Vibrio cholerae]KAA0999901.1 chromosome partitioning protein ParA [Vibrio cholerae]KAA1006796.1 chromosome partitioning protein ParA [Vibrio cholerae]KAA1015434.1 chromosome partitioning protein ParA [Vibrio cholerae]KAA1020427.1 chromosome partitioning protein ParA [Vibrio cholerae]
MSELKTIPAPEYMKGHEFTQMLKDVLGCKDFAEVSEILNIPKSTFSTWNLHDRTSHELMVRLHLAMGIPLEELALPQNVRVQKSPSLATSPKVTSENTELQNPQLAMVVLKSFCLTNGKLLETGEIPYPVRRMNSFNLKSESTIEVETNEALYLVDNASRDAVSGSYLIDIDGRLSINHIQRLPGKKLAIAFGGSTIEVSEHDIKVLGRVAVTLEKV